MRRGEGERAAGGKAGGPVLTASESVIEGVVVGILLRDIVPVIDFALLVAVVANVTLPFIVIMVIRSELVEDREQVVRTVSIWFEGLSRGNRADMRRLVD